MLGRTSEVKLAIAIEMENCGQERWRCGGGRGSWLQLETRFFD